MRRGIALGLALVFLSLGCTFTGGHVPPSKGAPPLESGSETSEPDASHSGFSGIHVGFGDVRGPAGIKGGTISVPGATLIGAILDKGIDVVLGLLGRAPATKEGVDKE